MNMKKIIAVSGVPGTGKSVVSRIVAKKTGANLIEIKKLIGKEIKYTLDKKRKTKVVNIDSVRKAVSRRVKPGLNIVEGHYSHLLKADKVIILRTSPAVLFKRLRLRQWPKKKIHENIECELLDEITQEAIALHRKSTVFEIDTTKRSPHVIAEKVIDIIDGSTKSHARIDWTVNYEYVFKNLHRYR